MSSPSLAKSLKIRGKSRKVLSIKDKCEILEKLNNGKSVQSLIKEYKICRTTIFGIKQKKDKILQFSNQIGEDSLDSRKTMKGSENNDLEVLVFTWIKEQIEKNGSFPPNELICNEALRIGKEELQLGVGFKATSGWLRRFKARFGMSKVKKRREVVLPPKRTRDAHCAGMTTRTSLSVGGEIDEGSSYYPSSRGFNNELEIDDGVWKNESSSSTTTTLPLQCSTLDTEFKTEESFSVTDDDGDEYMSDDEWEGEADTNKNLPFCTQTMETTSNDRDGDDAGKHFSDSRKVTDEEAFNAFETIILWAEEQGDVVSMEQLLVLRKMQSLAAKRALAAVSRTN